MGAAGAAFGLGRAAIASDDGTSKEPRAPDTDGDGLTDDEETNVHGTDPLNPDTDGDTLPDGWEVRYLVPTDPGVTDGLDPLDDGTVNPNHGPDGDPDGDGYANDYEYYSGTDPTDPASWVDPPPLPPGVPAGCAPSPHLPGAGRRAAGLALPAMLAVALARLRRRWAETGDARDA
jgi:hypothetical protein